MSAPVSGSVGLRIDDHGSARYADIQWQGYKAGQSVLLFAFNAEDCRRLTLILAPTTVFLNLKNPKIHELLIHQHGRPVRTK